MNSGLDAKPHFLQVDMLKLRKRQFDWSMFFVCSLRDSFSQKKGKQIFVLQIFKFRQISKALDDKYRKVVNSSLSWFLASFQIFRSLMKGKFDVYVL